MKFLSVCENCLQTYYLDETEVSVSSKTRINANKKKTTYMSTWTDWLMHIQSHCPMCRFECPANLLEQHNEMLATRQKEIEEIEKEHEDSES